MRDRERKGKDTKLRWQKNLSVRYIICNQISPYIVKGRKNDVKKHLVLQYYGKKIQNKKRIVSHLLKTFRMLKEKNILFGTNIFPSAN